MRLLDAQRAEDFMTVLREWAARDPGRRRGLPRQFAELTASDVAFLMEAYEMRAGFADAYGRTVEATRPTLNGIAQ